MEDLKKLLQEVLKPIHDRLDNMDKRFDSMDKRFDSMDKRFDTIEKDVKEVKTDVKDIKDKVIMLVDFERSANIAHERIDAKLKDIDIGIKVLADGDFAIKKDIVTVQEELKVIKGGK